MPQEMYEFIKSFSYTHLKNTPGFEIKFTVSVAGVCLFVTIVKGNSCLFETCVLSIAATAERNKKKKKKKKPT